MAVKSLNKKRTKTKPVHRWRQRFVFFFLGGLVGLAFLLTWGLAVFELRYQNKVYPGVKVANLDFGGQSSPEVEKALKEQNSVFSELKFTFVFQDNLATLSAQSLDLGFNRKLLADQAYLVGRSGNFFSALYQKWQAQRGEINLSASFDFDERVLDNFLEKLAKEIDVPAQEPLFDFSAGRVTAFRPAKAGLAIDRQKAKDDFKKFLFPPMSATIQIAVNPVEPKVKTEEANNLGIKELLAEGKSYFRGSIPGRIHNISLAASRLNGLLLAPGEILSFNQALGEVSAKTGYQQAYIIKERKTVLDDGGGVCQVSTTLFRAALKAGLPITERQAHAYRVSYYEQGGFGPGLDATVYDPTVDLKIKNDTPAHLLIQAYVNTKNSSLTFALYGTADGRQVSLSKPKVWEETPPPADLYQDDPNLPKGQVKQVDFAAWGTKTSFDYKVIRGEEVLQNRTFYSNFQPWQAIYLRGT